MIGRLRDGITREHAQAELASVASQLAREHPASNADWRVDLRPIRDIYVGDVRPLLWLLQGAVFLLLVIASSNVASLVLTRAAGREREIALRLALGARPAHLMRQFLAEGLLLALIGGLAGLALASWGVQVVPRWLGDRLGQLPTPDTVGGWIGPSVLLVCATATLAVGIVLGLVPVVRGLRLAHGSLKADGRGLTEGVRARRLRQGFVVTQVALAVCLFVGAGLLVRSFARLQERSFGFATEDGPDRYRHAARQSIPGTAAERRVPRAVDRPGARAARRGGRRPGQHASADGHERAPGLPAPGLRRPGSGRRLPGRHPGLLRGHGCSAAARAGVRRSAIAPVRRRS